MKKYAKLLCLLLAITAVLCIHTVAFAADDSAYLNQILGPLGASDIDGNLLMKEDGVKIELEADLAGDSTAIAWDVISGKDIISLTAKPGDPTTVLATPLANGEATVIAYLEDGAQASATRKIIVSNQTEPEVAKVTLTTSVEGDGDIRRMTGEDSWTSLGTGYKDQFVPGIEMNLVAVEKNYPFKYWVIRHGTDEDVIATTEKNYTFTLATDMTVVAVFDKSDDGKMFGTNVTFIYNNIVASNMYVKTLAKKAPDEPYQRNRIFDKWVSKQADAGEVLADSKVSKSELTEATTFTASYTTEETEYEITVIGGSGSGSYVYGEPVIATLTAEAEDGKQFLFWSKDGAPVSYDTTYAFSAMQDCTVVAVFGEATATDGMNLVMQVPVEDGNIIAFTFERYVPEDYHFVTSGFVVSTVADCVRADSANNLMEAVSYRDGVRTQFTKSLVKVTGVTTYYARGYVIYMDGDAVKTVYSEVQKFTL